LYKIVIEKTLPSVVGGTRHLGCWQRHSSRYAKHVKVLILIDFLI